jgi:hypothetical protein
MGGCQPSIYEGGGKMNQLNQGDMQTHVQVLGWLYILGNAIVLVMGILGFVFFIGIGYASGDPEAMRILPVIGTVAVLFMSVLALPGLVAGFGLLTRKNWARVLALVVGFLGLVNFPIGTAIGIYAIWVLLQQEANDYFAPMKPA